MSHRSVFVNERDGGNCVDTSIMIQIVTDQESRMLYRYQVSSEEPSEESEA